MILRTVREAGFSAVELAAEHVEASLAGSVDVVADVRRLLASEGLGVAAFVGAALAGANADEADDEIELAGFQAAFARDLGADALVIGAGDRKQQSLEQLGDALAGAAERASARGVRLLIENRRGSRVEQIEDLRAVVGPLPPSVGIAADVGEFHAAAVNAEHVFREFRGRVGLVRLSDRLGREPAAWGRGEVRFDAILRAARGAGVDGWLACAPQIPDNADAVAVLAVARRAIEAV